MPTRNIHQLAFGGVNDRDAPINFPIARSVRCKNWMPQRNGRLCLRWGYTQPAMSPANASDPIHSGVYYETFAGAQSILFGQGTSVKKMALSDGTVTTLSNPVQWFGNRWGHFRANNRVHLCVGSSLGVPASIISFDGSVIRPSGIRAPNSTETTSVSVSSTTSPAGSFSSTLLSGYQLYMAYYNPNTGQVGNRAKIGARQAITGSGKSLSLTGLPDLSAVNSEWVKVLGRTPDGGEVPYWFVDVTGSRIIAGNTATTATITLTDVDFNAELPTRNSVGVGFDGFARVGTRIFAKKPNDPYIYYSEAEEDYEPTGIRVGRSEESWPANNAELYPSVEVPTCVASYNLEGWFYSRNYLYRWQESLRQQLSDPWVGPWPVGCAGQRAFVVTPYGPFWLSAEKQLYTFVEGQGPVPIGDEYSRTLLSQITDAELPSIELTYHRDPAKDLDHIKILRPVDAPVSDKSIIIHDFLLRDSESPTGQGYELAYGASFAPYTFVGAGYSPSTPVRDTNKTYRCWIGRGVGSGRFAQMDDGTTDNSSTFSGDYLSGPIPLGDAEPQLIELEYIGDTNLRFSYETTLDGDLLGYISKEREELDVNDSRYAFKISDQGRFLKVRFQLDSNTTGNYNLADPYAIPLNTYGTVYEAILKLGAQRQEGR